MLGEARALSLERAAFVSWAWERAAPCRAPPTRHPTGTIHKRHVCAPSKLVTSCHRKNTLVEKWFSDFQNYSCDLLEVILKMILILHKSEFHSPICVFSRRLGWDNSVCRHQHISHVRCFRLKYCGIIMPSWYIMLKYSTFRLVHPFFENFDSKMDVAVAAMATALPSSSF